MDKKIKTWKVVCQVNMNAKIIEEVTIVKATTKINAELIAVDRFYRTEYSNVKVISCEEVIYE